MKIISREVFLIYRNLRKSVLNVFFVIWSVSMVLSILTNCDISYAQEATNAVSTVDVKYIELTVNTDKTGRYDATYDIQRALNTARYNATDYNRYKIIIPKGTYKLSKNLNIFSNTWLYLEEGAVIKRCFSTGCMLKNGVAGTTYYGYSSFKNIRLEGGTWDGLCFDEKYGYNNTESFSTIRFAHATNIEMINVAVINNKGGHHLEFGGIDRLTIKGCYFTGYLGTYKEDGSYIGKEVIQLDILHSADIFRGYEAFDDSALENVLIENNIFENVARGIGSHSAVVGRYYDNVIIRNNTFKNLTQQAIIAFNFKNCSIYNNNMENVGMGIDFKYMTNTGANFYMPNDKNEVVKIVDDAKTVIKKNRIITRKTPYLNTSTGINIFGYNMTSDNVNENSVKIYNYKVKNVVIEDNTIKSQDFAIYLNNADKCVINRNKLSFENSTMKYSVINLNGSSDNKITNNVITSSVNGGIYITSRSNRNVVNSNKINNIKGAGIRVYDESKANAINKNVINKAYNGVVLDNKASATIRNNSIHHSLNNGVIIQENAYTIMEYNNVYSNKSHGIVVSDTKSSNKIYKNSFNTNGKNGIYATNINKTSFISNNFNNNSGHGLGLGEKTKYVVLNGNVCIGNKKRAISSSILSSMNLESIRVYYNKNYKIIIRGNRNINSYMQYNNRTIATKKTSARGEATYTVASKYKNKKIALFIKDKYKNITKTYICIK